MNVGYYVPTITIAEIRLAKPRMIFYGANTCWWTHDERHLSHTKPQDFRVGDRVHKGVSLPCDPRGGMLMQTEDVEGFLNAAEQSADHYGRHGLRAFEASHHLNCRISEHDQRSTCFAGWDDYNRIIDEFDRRRG